MAICSTSRISYPARLFLWLLGYSLLMVGCFVGFQYQRERQFKAGEINSQLQLINAYILTELKEGNRIEDIRLDEFHPFQDLRVSVITSEGDVVYDNTLDSLHRTNHLDRQEVRQALIAGQGCAERRHSASTGSTYFYSATKGDEGYVVRTAVPYSLSLSAMLEADFEFLWIMGVVAVLMCVLGYFATRRVGVHISRLSRFARSVEDGAVISDTEPFPHDELGDISNHIVRLYASLQQANADRDAQHRAAMHEQMEKERIKKQLTNNINHELKTPVASVQVCVETLLAHPDMDSAKREEFLRRALANTARLRRLLGDVSLITRMDDGGHAIVKEPLDLAALVAEVVDGQRHVAEAKGIRILNTVTGPVRITGNRALLESVFNNLIDNAVAYSGGTEIRISRSAGAEGWISLVFSDDGSGIPEEHLPRIFERFYRIDRGRSREAGGTGLGLAIVKNAVLMHGGTVSVANIKGGGLSFSIVIPLS